MISPAKLLIWWGIFLIKQSNIKLFKFFICFSHFIIYFLIKIHVISFLLISKIILHFNIIVILLYG